MKTITIYTAGTLGDHLPFIRLGQVLEKKGYNVRLALNSSMCSYAEQVGLNVVPLTTVEGGEEEARKSASAWDFWNAREKGLQADLITREKYRLLVEQCRQLVLCCRESDLLISTTIRPQGYISSVLTNIPWISISMNPSNYNLPTRNEEIRQVNRSKEAEYKRHIPGIHSLIKSLGMDHPRPPFTPAWIWAPLVMLASSPHFSRPDPSQLLPQANLVQTGFIYYEDPAWRSWQPDEELRTFCEPSDPNDRPLVLAFSSQPLEDPVRILQNHALAAKILNKKLLVQRGWAGFSADMLPEGFDRTQILFRDFLPQDWLFARAVIAIQHGGIGSIARAIRQACPLLIEPFGNDQFFNANRVHELGIGAALHPFSTTPDQIAGAITEILTQRSVTEKLNVLSKKFLAEDGAENACQVIDQYMQQIPHPTRIWSFPPIYADNPVWQMVSGEK